MHTCYFLFFFLGFVRAINHHECTDMGYHSWLCDYMRVHGRNYSNVDELHKRMDKIRLAKPYVENGVEFGYTSRSDKFPHELRANKALHSGLHHKVKRPDHTNHVQLTRSKPLPPIDWRTSGRVTSVKDQGNCGGCFAFAAATVLEFWEGRYPKSLSSQSLMDCTSGSGRPDSGCDGGLMEYVFEYAKYHPVPLEDDIPYRSIEHFCTKKLLWSHMRVNNYKVITRESTPNAESQIEHLLHKYGPVAVGIDSTTMDNYKSGIFRAHQCTTDIEHAVTIVGYTKNFWVIKNSWSKQWGVDGYLYLERGKNACGVAEYIVYVSDAEPELRRKSTHWRFNPT